MTSAAKATAHKTGHLKSTLEFTKLKKKKKKNMALKSLKDLKKEKRGVDRGQSIWQHLPYLFCRRSKEGGPILLRPHLHLTGNTSGETLKDLKPGKDLTRWD